MLQQAPLLALAAALLTGSCTTTHQLSRPATVGSLQLLLKQADPVSVIVDTPVVAAPANFSAATRTTAAAVLAFDPTGIWVAQGGERRFLRLGDVRGVEVLRRGRGAGEGLGVGLFTGIALGALTGYLRGDDPPCNNAIDVGCDIYIRWTSGDKAIAGGIMGGVLGGVLGAEIGYLIGHRDVYVF